MRDASPEVIRAELDRVIESHEFAASERLSAFLRFVVEETLAGRASSLKEYVIATRALQRPESFDPRFDAIVRVEASKIRRKLAAYYANSGASERVRIELPKGGYAPVFVTAPVAQPAAPAPRRPMVWIAIAGSVLVITALLASVPHKQRHIPSTAAYDAYSRGKWFLHEDAYGHLDRSLNAFQEAIAADPNYAPSFAGLATAYVEMEATAQRRPSEVMPKARAAALRAIALDSSLAEAHLALGMLAITYDRKRKTGCAEIVQALRLNPDDAHAHMIHANFCLLRQGRMQEAKAEIQTAQRLDPVKYATSSFEITLALIEHRYDDALDRCRRIAEISPTSWNVYPTMAYIYVRKGMFAEARQMIDRSNLLGARNSKADSVLAQLYARMGDREKALRMVRKLEETSRHRYVPATDIALVYLSLSDKESALAWLERACGEHAGTVTGIGTNPAYDDIRGDPRFTALLKTIDLE